MNVWMYLNRIFISLPQACNINFVSCFSKSFGFSLHPGIQMDVLEQQH
jgi:hypothetical protein